MAGAKDENLIDDDTENLTDDVQDEAPKDVRGSIRAAMEEVAEKNGDREDVSRDRSGVRSSRIPAKTKSDSDTDSVGDVSEVSKGSDTDKKSRREKAETTPEQVSAKESKEEAKVDPPPFYKNKGKSTWDKLSSEDRQTILTREKEVSDGFAQYSSRIKNVEEIERAIAPRLQAIQQFGATPGAVVDRLFQWMEQLNNPQTKANTFKELARSFGVNINQLVPQQPNGEVTEQPIQDPNNPPEWFGEFTNTVSQEINGLKQTLSSQQQAALEAHVRNWAKDKPYYQQVGPLMGQLMTGGAVPHLDTNGNINLDGAYEAALKIHPEIAAQMQQDASQKAATEAAEKAAKETKERAERLARAKRAGSGIKPSAPSLSPAPTNPKLNGSKKGTSIRDAIYAARDEVRDRD